MILLENDKIRYILDVVCKESHLPDILGTGFDRRCQGQDALHQRNAALNSATVAGYVFIYADNTY